MRLTVNIFGAALILWYIVGLSLWIYEGYGLWGIIGTLAFFPVAVPVMAIFYSFNYLLFTFLTFVFGYIFLSWGHHGN